MRSKHLKLLHPEVEADEVRAQFREAGPADRATGTAVWKIWRQPRPPRKARVPSSFRHQRRSTGGRRGGHCQPHSSTRDANTRVTHRDDCPKCGGQLDPFGEDVSEILEVSARVLQSDSDRPAETALRAVATASAGAGAASADRTRIGRTGLAGARRCRKYSDHLPLYRRSESMSAKASNGPLHSRGLGWWRTPARWNLWSMPCEQYVLNATKAAR